MANLLSRLGLFSVRHPWRVLVGWLIVLALAGGAFLAFGGTLATSFNIPGTTTSKVTSQLQKQLDESGGATGTVTFQTSKGAALDDAQKTQITKLLKSVGTVKGVDSIVDPFSTATQRDAQAKKVSDGAAQLQSGQQQIDAGRQQLDAGQQQLDAAIAQAKAAGAYDQASAQFDAQQKQLDESKAQLDASQKTLDASKSRLTAAQQLLDDSAGIKTVSKDGTTALGMVQFKDSQFDLPDSVKSAVASKLDAAHISGVTINYSSEIATSVSGLIGPGEVTGVVIALLVLVLMLRALRPALMPLVSSLIGVGVGVAGAMAFSGVIDMSSVTPVLGVMLGLAVGIDYSLFIINRHRRQLLAGMEVRDSIGLANGTAGNAVVFAGATVLVALLALNITGIQFLGVMGTVGAVCVLIAVLIAVTLTPALLAMLGMRVLGRKARARIGQAEHRAPAVRPMRTSRAVLTVVVAVVGLLVVAIPALSMRLGLPDGSAESTSSTQYRAYMTVADKFGAGINGPLIVTATLPDAVSADDVTTTQAQIAGELMKNSDIVAVAPVGTSDARDFMAFEVVPKGGPSSQSTETLVHELRGASTLSGGVTIGVAGQASANIDVSEILANVLPIYLAVVIGLSLIIMIIVFRSLLVPLIATGGYVLSLFAAFGGMTAVYQWGWFSSVFGVHDPGPVLSFAPIIVMGVLFGLAMDYQLFLVSGMREAYVHGLQARAAVVSGLRAGRAVVTAAAIIMISVFGGFVFSDLSMVRPLGFGLAAGVLFDAFVVRMLLVPGLMHLFGKAAWWLPKWLDRIVPDVDVEGAALERTHELHGAAAEEPKIAAPA
ncbi:MMPL family transporter [Humibacter sp. RRB41]|uniref:MMPL family transporter n=1 Tax=Humibacter sp. RRB41 TaxID=2919946 RepID=UPI001FA95FBB|nr:MMPL family transporter [Humibacter sp. RRB41]